MPLDRLERYLILFDDIEGTMRFYTDVLGMEAGGRPAFPRRSAPAPTRETGQDAGW